MREGSDYIMQMIMMVDLPWDRAYELWTAGISAWTLTDFLLLPLYLFLLGFYYAMMWFEFATDGMLYLVAFAIVAFIVMNRIYLGEYQSAKYGTLTLISIYHPYKRATNFAKCMFWGVLSPFYGFWFMLTKGVAILIMAYLLPYMIIRRLFDKNYFDSAPIADAQERYMRTYKKGAGSSFWDVYRES